MQKDRKNYYFWANIYCDSNTYGIFIYFTTIKKKQTPFKVRSADGVAVSTKKKSSHRCTCNIIPKLTIKIFLYLKKTNRKSRPRQKAYIKTICN